MCSAKSSTWLWDMDSNEQANRKTAELLTELVSKADVTSWTRSSSIISLVGDWPAGHGFVGLDRKDHVDFV